MARAGSCGAARRCGACLQPAEKAANGSRTATAARTSASTPTAGLAARACQRAETTWNGSPVAATASGDPRLGFSNSANQVVDVTSPLGGVVVSPGLHRLRVEREGFLSYELTVDLPAGRTTRLTDITLQAVPQ